MSVSLHPLSSLDLTGGLGSAQKDISLKVTDDFCYLLTSLNSPILQRCRRIFIHPINVLWMEYLHRHVTRKQIAESDSFLLL